MPSCRKRAWSSSRTSAPTVSCSKFSLSMNVKPFSSLNRYVQSRSSIWTCSMVSPERKRSCSLLPSRSALASMATNAPPLPGLMCWTLAATQSLPLYSMTLPARMELTGTFMGLPGACRWIGMNGIRPRPQGRGEAGGAFYQRPPMAATGGRNRASQAQYRLLLPGQVGGDDGVGAFDVGPGLGRRQDPGIVERHPLGACQIGRGTEARRMRQRLIVLRRALEADAADRMIGWRNQAEHLAADLEDYNAFPLHGPCRGRQRAAERVDLLRRHGATLHGA